MRTTMASALAVALAFPVTAFPQCVERPQGLTVIDPQSCTATLFENPRSAGAVRTGSVKGAIISGIVTRSWYVRWPDWKGAADFSKLSPQAAGAHVTFFVPGATCTPWPGKALGLLEWMDCCDTGFHGQELCIVPRPLPVATIVADISVYDREAEEKK